MTEKNVLIGYSVSGVETDVVLENVNSVSRFLLTNGHRVFVGDLDSYNFEVDKKNLGVDIDIEVHLDCYADGYYLSLIEDNGSVIEFNRSSTFNNILDAKFVADYVLDFVGRSELGYLEYWNRFINNGSFTPMNIVRFFRCYNIWHNLKRIGRKV